MSYRGKPIKLSDQQAAMIATATLKPRRVPASTIRSWKHRDLIVGGHGWVDGAYLERFLAHLALGDTPMIASELAKRSDLVQHRRVFTVPETGRCA